MKRYNLIFVLDKDERHVLMCLRKSEPYTGLYNLVGGKIEPNENYLDSAYRELFEETGIQKKDIVLHEFIDYTWHPVQMKMYVFIGKLSHDVILQEEIHPLEWIPLTADFFDMKRFAGEGNIGHMMEVYKQTRSMYFKNENKI